MLDMTKVPSKPTTNRYRDVLTPGGNKDFNNQASGPRRSLHREGDGAEHPSGGNLAECVEWQRRQQPLGARTTPRWL
jgi:hypothetical protein